METVRKLEKALGVNGQLIEEFWPVLGEPSDTLKAWTAERLARSMAQAATAQSAPSITSAELRQRAKQAEAVTP